MSHIPSINYLGTGPRGTAGQENIINCTSEYASFSGLLKDAIVFLCVQGNNRKSLLDILEQEQNLFAAEAVPAGQPSCGGIELNQRVRPTAGLLLVGPKKYPEARFMVFVAFEESRDQDRGIEE